METSCEVCERRPATRRCVICGRNVCEVHINEEGVCVVCVDLMCRVCGNRLAVTSCAVCGRPVCRECSLELEPGIRVCRSCSGSYDVKSLADLKRLFRRHGLGFNLPQT
ncbi:MAG: hypothetical protein QXM76_04155 [Zestosphaera sp.]